MTDEKNIWEGDLFNMKDTANDLETYIKSVGSRQSFREDSKGFVLAIDADYGMGKTFFLKRLKEQLEIKHPVAYIDAWKDDLQDEPLIALIATLEEALEKTIKTGGHKLTEERNAAWENVKKALWIVAKGAMKKVAGILITTTAAEELSEIIKKDDEIEQIVEKQTENIGDELIDGATNISNIFTSNSKLEERLKDFKQGQKAINDLKANLASLIKIIKDSEFELPIVIIIDELDRCRPTYAIKLLEEIKHLFDVEGIVFVLGINANQLSKSINKVYGSEFEGHNYLSRFIDRKYMLQQPKLLSLVKFLMDKHNINVNSVATLPIGMKKNNYYQRDKYINFAILLETFNFSCRDTFKLFHILETCYLLANKQNLYFPYLIPLIIKEFWPENFVQAFENTSNNKLGYRFFPDQNFYSILDFFLEYEKTIGLPSNILNEIYKEDGKNLAFYVTKEYLVYTNCIDVTDLSHPNNYKILINKVCQFSME